MLLLTGATGLVGSTLLRRLLAEGTQVRCLVRDPRRLGAQRVRVQIALGDLTDPPSFRNALRGVRHGRAPRRVDPRPAAGLDRGAQRDRDLADGGGGRAPGRRALRVLLRARRLHAPPHALLAREGAGRAGRARGRPAVDRVRALDRLRPGRPVADAARADGAAAGDARVGSRARAVPADLGRGRRRLRDRRRCATPTARRRRRYELAGPETLSHEEIVRIVLRSLGRSRPLVHVPTPIVSRALRLLEAAMGRARSRLGTRPS